MNVDLRGHGESSRAALETYDAASYADDLAALIDELELAPVVVAGHSLGGVVAASLGARRPDLVRALLLEDPPMFEGDSARRNASPVAAFFPMLVAAVTDLQARNAPASEYAPLAVGSTTPEDVAARCLSLHRWDPVTMQAAVDGIVWSTFDPTATLSCPLTVLRADPKMGAVFNAADVDLVLDANPQADVHMVPGAPHSIHAVATSAYLAHLDAFLDELS